MELKGSSPRAQRSILMHAAGSDLKPDASSRSLARQAGTPRCPAGLKPWDRAPSTAAGFSWDSCSRRSSAIRLRAGDRTRRESCEAMHRTASQINCAQPWHPCRAAQLGVHGPD